MLYGAANPFSNSQRSVQPHSWKYFPTFHKKTAGAALRLRNIPFGRAVSGFLFRIEKVPERVCVKQYTFYILTEN